MSRVGKFFISMSNRGFMHGERSLFDGPYFGIELHMQKLYECDFELIFYFKMSCLVPQKITKIYVSFETLLFILQMEVIKFNPLFCTCIIDAYIEATTFYKQ